MDVSASVCSRCRLLLRQAARPLSKRSYYTVNSRGHSRAQYGALRTYSMRPTQQTQFNAWQPPSCSFQYRTFGTTRARRKAVLNPRTDEEGNEMRLDITPRAAKRLRQIAAKDSNPNLALRITVESGGCHGFQYLMSLTDTSKIDQYEDTMFENELEDDAGSAEDKARIVLDSPSLELLKGSKVDFTQELIGSQFKIVDNPAASSSCGCGTSFDIKA